MISVIIPLYNKEKSIRRTLECITTQTIISRGEADFEVIIVNDGSTDSSADVVKKWIAANNVENSRFRIIDQHNHGVSSARNQGIKESTGDYIAFLDADDLWESTYLEELSNLIIAFPDAAIYGIGIAHILNEEKGECGIDLPKEFRGVVGNVWEHNRMMWYTASSVCIPRNIIELFDERLTHGEDLDAWFRVMLNGPAVFYNKTLVYYVQDSENRAMSVLPPINRHIVSVIDKYAVARALNMRNMKSLLVAWRA